MTPANKPAKKAAKKKKKGWRVVSDRCVLGARGDVITDIPDGVDVRTLIGAQHLTPVEG